jgi:hypothetical protein
MRQKSFILPIVLLIAATLVASNGKAQRSGNPPPASSKIELTNKDIIAMAKAGLSAGVITAKIQTSACAFDTSPAALIELKSSGVPEPVILAMVKCPPSGNAPNLTTGNVPEAKPETSQQEEATPEIPKPQVTEKGDSTFPRRLYLTGSTRDVKMLTNALRAWTVGSRPCVQFVDVPEPGAYTLKFRWDNHYTAFVHSGTEADMDLYDGKGTLVYSEHKTVKAAGAYHEGHPEKAMYPKLYKALGCPPP